VGQYLTVRRFARAADSYRRIRNTARFLLANLAGFNPATDCVSPEAQNIRAQLVHHVLRCHGIADGFRHFAALTVDGEAVDSGSTSFSVVDARPEFDGHAPDMYLEGSDQHRGWATHRRRISAPSLSITSCGATVLPMDFDILRP
jgi:isoleucyl-tRNA synthetase